jgi:hypothetical protein
LKSTVNGTAPTGSGGGVPFFIFGTTIEPAAVVNRSTSGFGAAVVVGAGAVVGVAVVLVARIVSAVVVRPALEVTVVGVDAAVLEEQLVSNAATAIAGAASRQRR